LAFEVSFNYYCYATGSDGIPIQDHDTLPGEWFVAGDYTKTGEAGNFGTVRFYADLATATVSAVAHSHGLQVDQYTFASGTGRVEKIEFEDRLVFTVPAGFYADGVQVSLLGRAQGVIMSEVGASAKARCSVRLGTGAFEVDLLEVGIDEADTIVVDELFTVTEELVAPGATLNETQDYSEIVRASIRRAWTSANAYNPGGGSVIGDGEVDFEDGLRILAVRVPSGVSWTSESGVFPHLPSPVTNDLTDLAFPQLGGIYPNPFNAMTTISYHLPRRAQVSLAIYDLSGRLVKILVAADEVGTGQHEVIWNGCYASGQIAASGVYFCKLEVGEFCQTKRLALLK
jgi:hypothetical protein